MGAGTLDPGALALAVAEAERAEAEPIMVAEFAEMLAQAPTATDGACTRGQAIMMMWATVK